MGSYIICKNCGAKLNIPPQEGSVSLDGNVKLDGNVRVKGGRVEFGRDGKISFGRGGRVGFSAPKKLDGTCPVCNTKSSYEPSEVSLSRRS